MKYFPLFLLLFSCSLKTMPNRIDLGEAFYNCNTIAAGLKGVANLDETEKQLAKGHWKDKNRAGILERICIATLWALLIYTVNVIGHTNRERYRKASCAEHAK